jgi:acyl-CoA synthetase (NDP forming)
MVDDPGVGVTALAVDLVTEYDGDTAYPDAVLDVAAQTDEPLAVLASVASAVDRSTARRLRDHGIPVLEGARSGLAALGHLARWPLPVADEPARTSRRELPPDLTPLGLLGAYGVPVVQSRAAQTLHETLDAAGAIGYPVALKTTGVLHKTEVHGVVLGLADEASLRVAYADMAERLGTSVTVEPMIAAGLEISVGFVHDDVFGPLVVVAAGGTLVELLADRAVACPPVSKSDARRLLESLRIAPLFAGWRGGAAVDLDAVADVIVSFSEMAVDHGDVFDAVEANPVIATPVRVIAVDALTIAKGASPSR